MGLHHHMRMCHDGKLSYQWHPIKSDWKFVIVLFMQLIWLRHRKMIFYLLLIDQSKNKNIIHVVQVLRVFDFGFNTFAKSSSSLSLRVSPFIQNYFHCFPWSLLMLFVACMCDQFDYKKAKDIVNTFTDNYCSISETHFHVQLWFHYFNHLILV